MTAENHNGEWRMLFDGRSLDGWTTGHPDNSWFVDQGMLCCTPGKAHNLYTEETFENFILKLDFRIDPGMNSGVFLRCSDVKDPVNTGIEIQIYDTHSRTEATSNSCGAIYGMVAPPFEAVKPAGEWNTMTLTCDGPLIGVELNGHRIAEMNVDLWVEPGKNPDGTDNKFRYAWRDMPRRGHIMLQDYGANKGLMWFRNVLIKSLP